MLAHKPWKVTFITLTTVATILACALPSGIQLTYPETPGATDGELVATEDTSADTAGGDADTLPEEAPPTEAPPPSEPTPTLSHSTVPSDPGSTSSFVTDSSSKDYAPQKQSPIENFFSLLFERPFTSEVMDYQPHLDITRGELSVGTPFTYITIFVEEAPPADSTAHYGVELDLDKDGRGDWLLYGQVPEGTDWTVAGVKVYTDTNNDVGGATPVQGDGVATGLDGYDSLVYNEGYEYTDPDAAWVRRNPSNARQIQLAFKLSLMGNPGEFLWGVWADEGVVDHTRFDYNDHFTHEAAGSPIEANANYPVKDLYSLDNSCRWTYGFTPVNPIPGMCYIPPTPTPTPVPPTATPIVPGNITGIVFNETVNYNGARDPGEPGIGSTSVFLGNGACSSTGAGSTSTNSGGGYGFSNLTPGTYCVTVDIPLAGGCAGWHSLTGNSRTLNVPNGGSVTADFGFTYIICQ